MKKIMAAMLALGLLTVFIGCRKESTSTEIGNPYVEVKSFREASEATGIPMDLPDTLMNFPGETKIFTVNGQMIHAEYGSEGRNLIVRKAEGSDDISGDYSQYDVTVRELGGFEVTEKTKDGKTFVETWTDGTYSYSIQSADGFDRWDSYEIMADMMGVDQFTPRLRELKDGWMTPESYEFAGEAKDVYDRAEPLEGVGYSPIALIAQKAEGEKTYYCFLSEATVIYPGSEPFYVLMYLSEDADGVSICGIQHITDSPDDTKLLGGWTWPESNALTEENTKLFNEAMEGQIGIAYEPVAYLASQVVNGTNHCYLARITGVSPSRVSEYELIFITEETDGSSYMDSYRDVIIAISEVRQEG